MHALPGTPLRLMSEAAVVRGFPPKTMEKTMESDNFANAVSMGLAGGSDLPVEALQEHGKAVGAGLT